MAVFDGEKMRWQYHKLTSGAAVYAVTGAYFPTLMAMVGSILPDVVELGIVRHRTATHWPPPWLALAVLSYGACWFCPNIWLYLFFFIWIGALLHMGEDYLSITGIPFRSPGSLRRGAGLYVTGTMRESVLAISFIGISLLIAYQRGFLAVGHFIQETTKLKALAELL